VVIGRVSTLKVLTFEVSREAEAVVLDVTGSADAQPVIEQFFVAA
jgi:hypothetical protein